MGTLVGLGGGIYCGQGSRPLISRCTITGNSGRLGAGGVHCDGPSCIIEHCLVANNVSGWSIGGIECGGNSVVTDCTITNNYGGGIGCGGNAMVSHCIVQGNSYSGGISAWGNAVVSYCTITGNSAQPDWIVRGPRGGGIYCRDNVLIRNCLVDGNHSQHYSGGQFGGPIEGDGGGIFCWGGSPTIISCTITRNSADDYGGGIYCASGSPEITNCILWQNKATDEQQIEGNFSVSYSNVEGSFPGGGNIDADPLFADPNNGDYHLKSQAGRWDANSQSWVKNDVTSPCIDAGDPMSPIGHEPFPNGGRINMGAYGGTAEASKSYFGEPVCEVIVAGDINGDCIIDFKDLTLMALHWLEYTEPNRGGWRLVEDDTEDSYSCEGNFDIFYPCSNAVDEDWDTYALPTDPGATSYIYENYVIPFGIAMADFRIKVTVHGF